MAATKKTTRPRARQRTRALDIPESHTGTVEVKRSGYATHDGVTETETIRVPAFVGPVGRVRVVGSVTRNMGDYNSVRVEVSVEMPCYPSEAEVDRCYGWCSAKVDDKVARELRVATGVDAEGQEATGDGA